MSDYLPIEIQAEIVNRLPVKSVIQFRSVSKAWKALIDSPNFIAAYSVRQTQPHNLLIRYEFPVQVEKFVSIVDDDTFPQQRFAATVPLSIKLLHYSRIVGSSKGLLCLYGCYRYPDIPLPNHEKSMAVLWNPLIRKSIPINVPDVEFWSNQSVLGFGVCPITSDPKIISISSSDTKKSIPWNVKVYTLSSGEWRTPSCNLPRESIEVTWDQVVIGKFIYWLALDTIAINDGFRVSCTIMSFDMTTEEFREVYLPDSLTHPSDDGMTTPNVEIISISTVWESLAVLEYSMDTDKRICDVWMMEHGVPKSFTKLFTIKTPHAYIEALGFRKSGEPILEILGYSESHGARSPLVVYEPYSEHINDIGISERGCAFYVYYYMETLLLLNL